MDQRTNASTGFAWPASLTSQVLKRVKQSIIFGTTAMCLVTIAAIVGYLLLDSFGFVKVSLVYYLTVVGVCAAAVAWSWSRYFLTRRRIDDGTFGINEHDVAMISAAITTFQKDVGIKKPEPPWADNEERKQELLRLISAGRRMRVVTPMRLTQAAQLGLASALLCVAAPLSVLWVPYLSYYLGASEQFVWNGVMGGFVLVSAWCGILMVRLPPYREAKLPDALDADE
ncbi:MAG: hypothetical protein AAB480_03490 [Patescibacteria group bacterium]